MGPSGGKLGKSTEGSAEGVWGFFFCKSTPCIFHTTGQIVRDFFS